MLHFLSLSAVVPPQTKTFTLNDVEEDPLGTHKGVSEDSVPVSAIFHYHESLIYLYGKILMR